jgi:hypothetical protein
LSEKVKALEGFKMTDIEGALGKLGINAYTDDKREKTFREIMKELQDKFKQLSPTHQAIIVNMFFGR